MRARGSRSERPCDDAERSRMDRVSASRTVKTRRRGASDSDGTPAHELLKALRTARPDDLNRRTRRVPRIPALLTESPATRRR
jgi:hypothetical protein